MSQPPKIDIVVLAAGASTRLGTPKQLLPYNGTTFIRRTIETSLLAQADSVHVVFGYEAKKMKSEISDLQVDIVLNPHWQNGISTSIRSGIQSLESNIDAAIIVLCDQPKLSTAILNTSIVTCTYAGTVGVPTLYDRRIFPELLALRGDNGAKPIIERYAAERIEIDFSGGEVDIDTIADQGKL